MSRALMLTLPLLFACDGEPAPDDTADDTAETCPLDGVGQALVEQVIAQETTNAAWMLDGAEAQSVAWAMKLTGSDLSNIAVASLFFPCDAPAQYDPYCAPDPDDSRLTACSMLSCVEAGVHGVEAWFGDNRHGTSLERYPLSWDAPYLGGAIEADENPHITLTADVREVPEVHVLAEHSQTLTTADVSLDVSYTLDEVARHGEPATLEMSVVFPGLVSGAEVVATVAAEGDTISGEVTLDGEVLGTISGSHGPEVTWTACP